MGCLIDRRDILFTISRPTSSAFDRRIQRINVRIPSEFRVIVNVSERARARGMGINKN